VRVVIDLVATAVLAVKNVKLNPDPSGLPGSKVLEDLVNGLGFWALLAALAGMVVGCIVWAAGAHGHNHHMAGRGRLGTLACAAAALLIGAAPALVNFFAEAGEKVK
jgi:hypothetical protein